MIIAYCGNFRPEHSTETHLKKTLESMGHFVIDLQEDELTTDQIYEESKGADLFLYTRTWGFRADSRTPGLGLLEKFRWLGVPTVSYHLDLYFGIERERTIQGDPFWNTKYVFTPDGCEAHQQEFKKLGINHFYLKPGVFDQECYYGDFDERLAYDVIFVGSYHYHPEWEYRKVLIDWLRFTYGKRFGKFGNPEMTVRNKQLNDLYASSKIVIGDSLSLGFNHPYYWSDRVYETLGRGGFMIHPKIKGLEEEFEDGKHLAFYDFGDFKQLQSLIDFYLTSNRERESIRRAGHELVKSSYTYKQRLEQVFKVLAKYEPNINLKLKEKV